MCHGRFKHSLHTVHTSEINDTGIADFVSTVKSNIKQNKRLTAQTINHELYMNTIQKKVFEIGDVVKTINSQRLRRYEHINMKRHIHCYKHYEMGYTIHLIKGDTKPKVR